MIKKRKLAYFRHITRKRGDCLEKITVIQGAMPGRRKGRAWKHMVWIENIQSVTRLTLETAVRLTIESTKWIRVVHNVDKSWNKKCDAGNMF